jgi:DNA-binding SARP family transcriptional activator
MVDVLRLSQESPLIRYAIRKLNPEIFSHPVWVRFWGKNITITLEAVQGLYAQAERLQADHTGDACQILLICSALQSYMEHLDNALRSAQQALALAERNRLSNEIIWATWGACAICYQAANYEQAIRYLEYLESELNDQHDWVLADFIEMIAQDLLSLESLKSNTSYLQIVEQTDNNLSDFTETWLQSWGIPPLRTESIFEADNNQNNKHGFLRNRLLAPFITNRPKKKPWNSLINSLQHLPGFRTIRALNNGDLSRLPKVSNLPSIVETSNKSCLSYKSKTAAKENDDARLMVSVVVQMLGNFRVTIQDSRIKVPASRSLSLFKYLLLHHKQDIPREVLMDIFWPDSDVDAARNNLNVAMHNLRQVLRSATEVAVIRFEDGAYGLSNNVDIWLDVEEFERCIKEGQQLEAWNQTTDAVINYEIAVHLYQGDFLADSPYEEWAVVEREHLQMAFLEVLDQLSQFYFSQERYTACITECQLALNYDRCREDVHCRLMQCYSRLGQVPLAMRQYQTCVEALRDELDVGPAPETTQLYEQIRHRETV